MSTAQPPFQPPPQQSPPTLPSPFPPIPQKRKRFGWLALILTAVISLGVGGVAGGSGDATTTAQPAPTATVTVTDAPGYGGEPTEVPGPEVTVTATATAKAEPKAEPKTEPGLGEGTYQVGTDAPAGRYKTTVPGDSSNCYWQRAKDDSGELDSIIANENANPGARVSVTLKKGEFFTSNGCGTWVRQ